MAGVRFDGPSVTADQRDLVLWLILWLVVVWYLPPWQLKWRPNAVAAVFVGLLAALAFLNLHHVSEFLYFKY